MVREVAKAGRPSREMALPRHLQIVVVEADHAEAKRHREHDPDVGIARVRPQHRRDHDAEQDHQSAHRGRAGLREMRLRAVGADRLALALPHPQVVDDRGAEQEHEDQRGQHRAARADGQVAEDVEDRDGAGEIGQPVEHRINLVPGPPPARRARDSGA
jgi:hypothetical protein